MKFQKKSVRLKNFIDMTEKKNSNFIKSRFVSGCAPLL